MSGRIISAAFGFAAINKKAASPMVATRVAKIALKEIAPLTYKVITMIAPPHPGRTPKNAAIKISNFLCLCKNV